MTKLDSINSSSNCSSSEVSYDLQLVQLSIAHEEQRNALEAANQELRKKITQIEKNYKVELEKQKKKLTQDIDNLKKRHSRVQEISRKEIKQLKKLNAAFEEECFSMRGEKRHQELKYINLQNQFAVFKTLHTSKIRQLIRNPEIFSVNRSKQLTENRIKEQKYFDERQKETTIVMAGLYSALNVILERVAKIIILKETLDNSWRHKNRQMFDEGLLRQTFTTLSVIHDDEKFAPEFQNLAFYARDNKLWQWLNGN